MSDNKPEDAKDHDLHNNPTVRFLDNGWVAYPIDLRDLPKGEDGKTWLIVRDTDSLAFRATEEEAVALGKARLGK